MSASSYSLRSVRPQDLEPLLLELNAISRQAEDIQHRIALLQAGTPLVRPGWPMRRLTPIEPGGEGDGWLDAPEDEGPVPDPPDPEPGPALTRAEEDPVGMILRIAGDLAENDRPARAPSDAEARIRSIRHSIAKVASPHPREG